MILIGIVPTLILSQAAGANVVAQLPTAQGCFFAVLATGGKCASQEGPGRTEGRSQGELAQRWLDTAPSSFPVSDHTVKPITVVVHWTLH